MNVRNSVPPTTAAWLGLQRLIKKNVGENLSWTPGVKTNMSISEA